MKYLVLSLLLVCVGISSFASAPDMYCEGDLSRPETMNVYMDQARLRCSGGYYAEINGLGYGAKISVGKFAIFCNGNTSQDVSGIYVGNKIDVNLIAGMSFGLYTGMNGICYVRSGQTGLGSAISVSTLHIFKK